MNRNVTILIFVFLLVRSNATALDVVVLKSGAELRGEVTGQNDSEIRLDLLPGAISLQAANVSEIRHENDPDWYINRIRGRDYRQAVHILESAMRAGITSPLIRNAYLKPAIGAAREHLENKRYVEASELCRRAIDRHPDSTELAELLQRALTAIARTEAEIQALNLELQRNPQNDYARLLLGRALRSIGRVDEAFAQYRLVVKGKIEREYDQTEIDELERFIAENIRMQDVQEAALDAAGPELPIETVTLSADGFSITVHDRETGLTLAQALPEILQRVANNLSLAADFRCNVIVVRDRQAFVDTTGHIFGEGYALGDTIWTWHGAPGMLENVLPHELAHVLLHHTYGSIPEWLDEGLAVRQEETSGAYWHVLKTSAPLPLRRLLNERAPAESKAQNTLFYASAFSFTDMLIEKNGMQGIHRFIRSLKGNGIEHALREVYGAASISDLQKQWKEHLAH